MCFFIDEWPIQQVQQIKHTEEVSLANNSYSNYLIDTYIRLLSHIVTNILVDIHISLLSDIVLLLFI